MIRPSLSLWTAAFAACALAACAPAGAGFDDASTDGDARVEDTGTPDTNNDARVEDARPDARDAAMDAADDAAMDVAGDDAGDDAPPDASGGDAADENTGDQEAGLDAGDDAADAGDDVADAGDDAGPREANCADGADDDGDGATDCADPDCRGVMGCQVGAESSCGDGRDNDGDGRTDCADGDCATTLACTHACPAGRTPLLLPMAGLPAPIADYMTTTGSGTVDSPGVVTSAVVAVDINHTFDGDLNITLNSPSGTAIALSSSHGSSGENYTGTVFTDAATTAIASGSPPYTGDFRPDSPLSALYGQAARGRWSLDVADHSGGDTGTFNGATLLLCVCGASGAPCELGALCSDGQDNDGDGRADCADADCAGTAGCEAPEATCNDSRDNDGDGSTDCADTDCNNRQGCEFGAERTCGDRRDNDGDGATDCADSDCATGLLCQPESDCADRVDNDADGATDCADVGCNGVSGCEYQVETSCNDRRDNDGDGRVDCADSDCANLPVCLALCPTGTTATVYTAADDPQSIPDPGTATSRVTVPDLGVVVGLAARVTVTHPNDRDLTLSLTSPAGTSANLAVRVGNTGDNFTNTVFTDGATASITTGSAPFTGNYRPADPLSRFVGTLASGQWRLAVNDSTASNAGSIQSFALIACVCNGTDGCEVGSACGNGVDDDGDRLADCADPDCNGVGYCEAGREVSCADGNDNDGDGQVDCHDADCDGVSGCETGAERTCDDRRDNDQDGATDCADSDCASGAVCGAESDCANGVDDDADGRTDCADIGCNGTAGCQFGAETSCTDGVDNDGDGLFDCADPDCRALELCTAGCPNGTTPVVYTASDVPAPIYDNQISISSVSVSQTGHVAGLAVRVNIAHTADGDLDISLQSPSNTTLSLSARHGAGGDNYNNTLFIDSATTPIASGTAPFTGSYQPDQPLSTLNGELTSGQWKLRVRDAAFGDTGTLNGYTLYLCVGP